MRGSTAKALRYAARVRYREMVAAGALNPPESIEHMRHQQRVLYRSLKKAYGSMPLAARQRFLEPLKSYLIGMRDSKSSARA